MASEIYYLLLTEITRIHLLFLEGPTSGTCHGTSFSDKVTTQW